MEDRLTEAQERIAQAVADIASGADWQRMLTVAARFHQYSTGALT